MIWLFEVLQFASGRTIVFPQKLLSGFDTGIGEGMPEKKIQVKEMLSDRKAACCDTLEFS